MRKHPFLFVRLIYTVARIWGISMELSLYLFIALFIGLLAGAVVSWLVQRVRMSAAVRQTQSEYQIELARLNERLISTQEESSRVTLAHTSLQQQASAWRDQLDTARDERAQLQERATGLAEQLTALQQEKGTIGTSSRTAEC